MTVSSVVEQLSKKIRSLFGAKLIPMPLFPGAAPAFFALATLRTLNNTVTLITDSVTSMERVHRDLSSLAPNQAADILFLPPKDSFASAAKRMTSKQSPATDDPDITGQRLSALLAVSERKAGSAPFILVTCIQALMQKTLPPEKLAQKSIRIKIGSTFEPSVLLSQLADAGYKPVEEVTDKCQAVVHGCIMDLWPVTSQYPVRIEFDDETVVSLRAFDPITQRSTVRITSADVTPANELLSKDSDPEQTPMATILPANGTYIWLDLESIRHHASLFEQASESRHLSAFDEIYNSTTGLASAKSVVTEEEPTLLAEAPPLITPLARELAPAGQFQDPDSAERSRQLVITTIKEQASREKKFVLFFETEASARHFVELSGLDEVKGISILIGRLSGGFGTSSFTVLCEADIYGRKISGLRYQPVAGAIPPANRSHGMKASDLTDIEPGDYVVHVEHGIGIYRGLNEITFNGSVQETLTLEYQDGAKLHVPVSHAHLLSRYVTLSKKHPKLHRLGGRRWNKEKLSAEKAIMDYASSLLETQAKREILPGHAFSKDKPWQRDFEASFPYIETLDQTKAIVEVKADMESTRPMDRLICGDAGYGKTEVAMRAAFKTAMDNRQTALLTPTTVLAQQHFDTFRERMAPYPIRIEMLSRFCSPARRKEILRDLAEGLVDIVIGTHALIQPNVKFNNLGLVIIDEEQRFGVENKERLKHMRHLVDVLTLTATPIPRTLYMSLTGGREMSLIQTPPIERMSVETIIAENTDEIIRKAIMHEINRKGQVFYLHNRILSIDFVRERLANIVPEAKIITAHGRMPSQELSDVMRRFARGEADVLLCTTIIESGVDIPRANTILIDRADRFGIADLYQLRGRVGRANLKAYAYLLLPRHGTIDSDARERIRAVKKHSALGAGFHLAMRDLEIRGAGNILGLEQSGHIHSIGFGLYCRLLKQTMDVMRGKRPRILVETDLRLDFIALAATDEEKKGLAIIPFTYIEDERARINVYRKIAEAMSAKDVRNLNKEIADRYGPIPLPLKRLLAIAQIRIASSIAGITSLETREDRVLMMRKGEYITIASRLPRLRSEDPDRRLAELLRIVQKA